MAALIDPRRALSYWPGMSIPFSGSTIIGNRNTIDAAGEYHTFVQKATEDMAISHVAFIPAGVSGSPTVEIRIETVDASGVPTGTLWATNTNAVSGTLTAGAANLTALTAVANISRGQWFAVKFLYASGTNFITSEIQNGAFADLSNYFSYHNTGTPTRNQYSTMFALGSSTTQFYMLAAPNYPISSVPNSGNLSSTNGNRFGARFQVPFRCRILGLVALPVGATVDFDATLYDDAGNAISGATGTHQVGYLQNSTRISTIFGTPAELQPGTWYRAAVVATSTTNISFRAWATPSTDYLTACPGRGNFRRTDYTTAGGWSDTNAAHLPGVDLIIDRLPDGLGGKKIYGG